MKLFRAVKVVASGKLLIKEALRIFLWAWTFGSQTRYSKSKFIKSLKTEINLINILSPFNRIHRRDFPCFTFPQSVVSTLLETFSTFYSFKFSPLGRVRHLVSNDVWLTAYYYPGQWNVFSWPRKKQTHMPAMWDLKIQTRMDLTYKKFPVTHVIGICCGTVKNRPTRI